MDTTKKYKINVSRLPHPVEGFPNSKYNINFTNFLFFCFMVFNCKELTP